MNFGSLPIVDKLWASEFPVRIGEFRAKLIEFLILSLVVAHTHTHTDNDRNSANQFTEI